MTHQTLPSLRWGVLGTGWISTNFVKDLLVLRPDALATHSVVALGSSSLKKGNFFVEAVWGESTAPRPQVYDSYQSVYDDPDVEIVYIGTPHALHKQNCLEAIAAGKHVLCEKPFTINEKEAQEVIAAAKAKGVFLMEAVWTRFFPIMSALHSALYTEKSIGQVNRMFCDFGLNMPMAALPASSRLKDPALGAGALLDIGIYCLTLASLLLGDGKVGDEAPLPDVMSSMTVVNGVDYSNAVVLNYKETGRLGICTSTLSYKSAEDFCRVEGSEGTITVFGQGASVPSGFRVKKNATETGKSQEETFSFDKPGMGFFYEADAVAINIENGRKENDVMPLSETLRILRLMDGIREVGGVRYPQD